MKTKKENENLTKKDQIESRLIIIMVSACGEIPENYEVITQFVFENILETADPVSWNDSDVKLAFKRWIEEQSKVK